MRKIFLIGMLALNLLFSKPIHEANTTQIPKFSLEKRIEQSTIEKNVEYEILQEEFKYLREDKLYRIVRSCYERLKSEGLDIPDYITPQLIRAIARIESTDDPNAVGKDTEKGAWQITRWAWKQVGNLKDYEENGFDPEINCEIAIKCLVYAGKKCKFNYLRKRGYSQNWDEISDIERIAWTTRAYNCGATCVDNTKGDSNKLPGSTQYYFIKLDGALKKMFPVAYKNNFAVGFIKEYMQGK